MGLGSNLLMGWCCKMVLEDEKELLVEIKLGLFYGKNVFLYFFYSIIYLKNGKGVIFFIDCRRMIKREFCC